LSAGECNDFGKASSFDDLPIVFFSGDPISELVRMNNMRIGIFADAHDHLDNLRRAVALFNVKKCDLVVFAGDLVSTISVPPLRKLNCPLLGCFGDNEGNRTGIHNGMSIIGILGDPPLGIRTQDGRRILVTHQWNQVRNQLEDCEVVIYGHTHRASIGRDERGRLMINPGETGGWTYGKPSVAILETDPLEAQLLFLDDW
tara:strand:- start:1488 stop:2090 length:603 start_codon:yes stop_codon:yes gene_type:complete